MSVHFASFGWIDLIGMIGTMMIVFAYFASQMRYINSSDLLFPVLNLVGSTLLTFSLVFNFNLAAFILELFWAIISLVGIWQGIRQRKMRGTNEKAK